MAGEKIQNLHGAPGVRRPVRERELLRVAGVLSGDDAKAAADTARREILAWATKQVGGELPAVATEGGHSSTCAEVESASAPVSTTNIVCSGLFAPIALMLTWRSESGQPKSWSVMRQVLDRRYSACACWPARQNLTCRSSRPFRAWFGRSRPCAGCGKMVAHLPLRIGRLPHREMLTSWWMSLSSPRGLCRISCARLPKAKLGLGSMLTCWLRPLWALAEWSSCLPRTHGF